MIMLLYLGNYLESNNLIEFLSYYFKWNIHNYFIFRLQNECLKIAESKLKLVQNGYTFFCSFLEEFNQNIYEYECKLFKKDLLSKPPKKLENTPLESHVSGNEINLTKIQKNGKVKRMREDG